MGNKLAIEKQTKKLKKKRENVCYDLLRRF